MASLGEFILLSILMFHVAHSCFTVGDFKRGLKHKGQWKLLAFFFPAFYFSLSVALLKILLVNSNISLEFLSNLEFSLINLFAFIGISLQVLGFVIILWNLRRDFYKELGGFNF